MVMSRDSRGRKVGTSDVDLERENQVNLHDEVVRLLRADYQLAGSNICGYEIIVFLYGAWRISQSGSENCTLK